MDDALTEEMASRVEIKQDFGGRGGVRKDSEYRTTPRQRRLRKDGKHRRTPQRRRLVLECMRGSQRAQLSDNFADDLMVE